MITAALAKIMTFAGAAIIICRAAPMILGQIPSIGKLPGDIILKRDDFTFFITIGLSIIISGISSVEISPYGVFEK